MQVGGTARLRRIVIRDMDGSDGMSGRVDRSALSSCAIGDAEPRCTTAIYKQSEMRD
jgi:hypothetical protein